MVFRLIRLYRRIRSRKSLGFGMVFILLMICIVGNALCYYFFDRVSKPELTLEDALWYSVISMTTIGYGDHYAVSRGARGGTILFVVLMGLSTFTVFLAMLIDWGTDLVLKGQRGMTKVIAKGHILLVNFPSETRIKQLITEIRSDPQNIDVEIVVVTDQVERLPFAFENVLFVKGSPLELETYDQARMKNAKMVIVLATSYSDPNSDAIVASTVSVIDSIKADAHIVAECLDEKHRMLFTSVRCDAIVFGLKIAGNLLVQEMNDPGVTQVIDVITSNLEGETLFSTRVDKRGSGKTYGEMAKALIDKDVNLICINRGENTYTTYRSVRPEPGDFVIYIARRRLSWAELQNMAKG